MPDLRTTTIAIPVLETDRLRLRGHTLADFDACLAMWSDPAVTRFIGGRPSTPDEVWTRILRYLGHWAALGYSFWAMEEKATGAFLGELGFADFRRGLGPAFDSYPEMGWALAPAAHGKGYAREALTAALAWGDAHLGADRYVCMIAPENAPSIRVAEKIAFQEYERTAFKGAPTVLFARARP